MLFDVVKSLSGIPLAEINKTSFVLGSLKQQDCAKLAECLLGAREDAYCFDQFHF